MNAKLVYSVEEVAELLSVSKFTIYRLLHRGLLKSNKALRKKLILKSELERFLSETE